MEEIKELTKAVYRIEVQQNEMSTVLSGNEKYGIPGMKHEISDIKEEIKAIKEDRKGTNKRLFRVGAISAGGGGLVGAGIMKLGFGKAFAIWLKLFGL